MDNTTGLCIDGRYGCKCRDTTENEDDEVFLGLFWCGFSVIALAILFRGCLRTRWRAKQFAKDHITALTYAVFFTEMVSRWFVFSAVLFHRNSIDRDPGQWITNAGKEQVAVTLLVATGTGLALAILVYPWKGGSSEIKYAQLGVQVDSTDEKPHFGITVFVAQNIFHLYAVLFLLSPWGEWSRSTTATALYAGAVIVNAIDHGIHLLFTETGDYEHALRVVRTLVSEGANAAAMGYTATYLFARPCGGVPRY